MKKVSVLLFIFLALAADLKVTIFPYIHWVAWLVLIFPFMIWDFVRKGFVISPLFGMSIIIFVGSCLISVMNNPNLETLTQVMKLIIIFFTIYYFLYYNICPQYKMLQMFNLAVVLNSLLLIIGLLGYHQTAQLMTSDGRWGTFFAYPGSLVKVGIFAIYVNLMSFLLVDTKKKVYPLVMGLLSLFIIYMDGSRTGMLLLVLTLPIVFLFYILINFTNKLKLFKIFLATFVIVIAGLGTVISYLAKSRLGSDFLQLMNSNSFAQGLELIDPARYMMLISALNKISINPFIGTGAFTTVGTYADGSSMVVHNTYLQVWGDYGLFGLIGVLFIYFGWIFLLPSILRKIQIIKNQTYNVIVCSSVLMLVYSGLNGLFHPFSTEFAEWIIFIIPLSICYQFANKNSYQQI